MLSNEDDVLMGKCCKNIGQVGVDSQTGDKYCFTIKVDEEDKKWGVCGRKEDME